MRPPTRVSQIDPAGATPSTRRGRGPALWLLGVATLATTLGMAAATFRGDGTAINAFLFLTWELSHVEAGQFERTAMTIVLVLSIVALIRPHWSTLLPVAVYVLIEAVARRHERGYVFSEWALTAQAPRYLTPLAMVLLLAAARSAGQSARGWRMAADGLLRAALMTVFAVHGLEALRAHPGFVDLLISSAANLISVRLPERTATLMLQIIGGIDLIVAAAILLRPRPVVLWWAAFWGLITALSRVTGYGWGAYPDVLVRAPHFLGPLALWYLARSQAVEGTLRRRKAEPLEDGPVPDRPIAG